MGFQRGFALASPLRDRGRELRLIWSESEQGSGVGGEAHHQMEKKCRVVVEQRDSWLGLGEGMGRAEMGEGERWRGNDNLERGEGHFEEYKGGRYYSGYKGNSVVVGYWVAKGRETAMTWRMGELGIGTGREGGRCGQTHHEGQSPGRGEGSDWEAFRRYNAHLGEVPVSDLGAHQWDSMPSARVQHELWV